MNKSATKKRKSFNNENTDKENSAPSHSNAKHLKVSENLLTRLETSSNKENLNQSPLKSKQSNVPETLLINRDPIIAEKIKSQKVPTYDIEKDLNDKSELVELRNIKEILSEVAPSGVNVCGGEAGEMPICPGLKIKKFGNLETPISETQAQKLMKICKQAPFGHKRKTMFDKKVRDTFQLEPSQIEVTNPEWNKQLDVLVARVAKELGCNGEVNSNLYKMLLYEKGGHFKKHRDTEKEEGMFATLIIQLPSKYTGGELVTHEKDGNGGQKERIFDFGKATKKADKSVHFACHYADVEHEIQKLKSGYRIVLVYNLTWSGNTTLNDPTYLNANNHLINRMVATLKKFNSYLKSPLAIILNHSYTTRSFETNGIQALKGIDFDRFCLFQNANEQLSDDSKLEYYMGSMNLRVYYDDSEADCEGRRWPVKGNKHMVSDDSDDENLEKPWDKKKTIDETDNGQEDAHCSNTKKKKKSPRWKEVEDREYHLDRDIIKSDGQFTYVDYIKSDEYINGINSIDINNLLEVINPNNKQVDEKMELKDLNLWGSDKEHEKSGWTGNEGSTKVTIYKKYILMFWPECTRFEHLVCFRMNKAIDFHLESYGIISSEEFLNNFIVLFKKMKQLDHRLYIGQPRHRLDHIAQILSMLMKIDSLVLIRYFIGNLIGIYDSDKSIIDSLAAVLVKYGWEDLKEAFERLLLPVSSQSSFLVNIHLVESLSKTTSTELATKCFIGCILPVLEDKEMFEILYNEKCYGNDPPEFNFQIATTIDDLNSKEYMDKFIHIVTGTFTPEDMVLFCKKIVDKCECFGTKSIFELLKFRIKWLEEAIKERSEFTWKMEPEVCRYNAFHPTEHKSVLDFFHSDSTEFQVDFVRSRAKANDFVHKFGGLKLKRCYKDYTKPIGHSATISVTTKDNALTCKIVKSKQFHDNMLAKHIPCLQDELNRLKAHIIG